MTTQELIKWIIEFCYTHYVLTTVFLIAIACIRPFAGIVNNDTYIEEERNARQD